MTTGPDPMTTCPRCGWPREEHSALSRRDNRTPICDACGTEEALVDLMRHLGHPLPPDVAARERRMEDVVNG